MGYNLNALKNSFCNTVESILCGFIGAIGDKSGKGYQSGAIWAKEISATA